MSGPSMGDRTAYMVVDSYSNFSHQLSSSNKTYEIAAYTTGICLTMWPFRRTPIIEDPAIGENMVALYEKHFDGYGQIKRWNYKTKEVWGRE